MHGGTLYLSPYVRGILENNIFENVLTKHDQTVRPRLGDVMELRGSMQFTKNTIRAQTAIKSVPIISYRASDIGSFLESDDVEVSCPVGYDVQVISTFIVLSRKRKPVETLWIHCTPCDEAMYSLTHAQVVINNLDVHRVSEAHCKRCPYGAHCHIDVKAKANFWGESHNNEVAMYLCPEEYCCQDLVCSTYDICAPHREGILCGQCEQGYSESLFSAKCIKNEECTYATTFWLVIVLYGLLYVVFFILEEEWGIFLGNFTSWLKSKMCLFMARQPGTSASDEDDVVGAYLSIFMYYIQVPNILKISILYRHNTGQHPLHELVNTVQSVFSFNTFGIHLKTCILEGVTAVFKIWIKLAFVFYLFVALVLMFLIVKPISRSINTKRKKSLFSGSSPLNAKFLAAFISLLLYTYQYLAENSFSMLKCLDITSINSSVLLIDASVVCYESWQFGVIVFVSIYVIPFGFVLTLAPNLLGRNVIGIRLFITSMFIPLFCIPIVLLRFIRYHRSIDFKQGRPASSARVLVSRLLSDPYRGDICWGICWEGVITLRRLLLILIATFTSSILLRHILLYAACQIILIIQLLLKPFRKRSCNRFEVLSLTVLTIVSVMNLVKAAYFQSGEIPDPGVEKIFEAYDWAEAVLFGMLPLVVIGIAAVCILLRILTLPLRACRMGYDQQGSPPARNNMGSFSCYNNQLSTHNRLGRVSNVDARRTHHQDHGAGMESYSVKRMSANYGLRNFKI